METVVLIIGAGPSGLATSACLTRFSIPHIILEKEDTYASLWTKRTYDRLKLHLAKEFCSLPHAPHPSSCPTYIPKDAFLSYLERYVTTNNINPKYNQCVVSAFYNAVEGKWVVETTDVRSGEVSVYSAKFLVIGTGENDAAYIPKLDALDTFTGEVLHSNQYKSASKYQGQNVLVIGCGNSGMEIAYDLSNYGASTSICIRSPVHVLTKELVHLAMTLLSYFPVSFVDFVILMMARLVYGDLSKYGIRRPATGPMKNKILTGRSAVIDVGTVKKIKNKQIEVVPGISSINKNKVVFANGNEKEFDAIIFATGYRSNVTNWLKDYKFLNLNENGMPDLSKPNYWKGKNGVYCAGFSRRGLHGVSMDAQSIAADINKMVNADAGEP